jgi:hypothetical protein
MACSVAIKKAALGRPFLSVYISILSSWMVSLRQLSLADKLLGWSELGLAKGSAGQLISDYQKIEGPPLH